VTAVATTYAEVPASGPQLLLDPAAIGANTRLLADRAAGDLMAVVKADGFGHGADLVARAALANGASSLGVTSIAEGLALRTAGLRAPVLSWLNPVDADFGAAVAAGIELAVPSVAHLEAVLRTSRGARVHLHLRSCGSWRYATVSRSSSSPTHTDSPQGRPGNDRALSTPGEPALGHGYSSGRARRPPLLGSSCICTTTRPCPTSLAHCWPLPPVIDCWHSPTRPLLRVCATIPRK
jgi:hypothetical protein